MNNPKKSNIHYFRIAILGIILGIPLTLVAILFVPMLPFIYYADYNKVKARLEQLPNTQIVDTWTHEDITLEDFGFTLQTRNCPPITINFYSVHQSRWHDNFEQIDGIVLLNDELHGKEVPQRAITRISRQELDAAGLSIQNIEDVITHFAPLLRRINEQPPEYFRNISGLDAAYVHLSYPGNSCAAE